MGFLGTPFLILEYHTYDYKNFQEISVFLVVGLLPEFVLVYVEFFGMYSRLSV